MTIFPSGKGVSVTREFFEPTTETPIKPSLSIYLRMQKTMR